MIAPPTLERSESDTRFLRLAQNLNQARKEGAKVQARASLSFFFAGLALFFVAIVFDIVLISGGLIGVPYKAANFAQPFWLSGILIALLGLLPSYQKSQIVVAGIMAISAPLGAFAFTYTLDPPLSVVCAADYTSATADGCAMQVYSTVAYAVTGITCSALVLPAVRRRDGTWAMQPSVRLRRLWAAARLICLLFAANTLPLGVVALVEGVDYLGAAANLFAGSCALLLLLAFRPSSRRRMHALLFEHLHFDDQSRAAAMVASMTGGITAEAALQSASLNFRVVDFSELRADDFASSQTHGGPATARRGARTRRVALGECDAFVSHSWSDDGDAKFCALRTWAEAFTARFGRTPLLWVDKFSLNQGNLSQGLASLPVNLAGCARLVCLLGPTYLDRLWTLLELLTFTRMGADHSALVVLPIGRGVPAAGAEDTAGLEADQGGRGAKAEVIEKVKAFALRDATCFDHAERDHLLEVIASGCGSHLAFERMLRAVLMPALTDSVRPTVGVRRLSGDFAQAIRTYFTQSRRPSATRSPPT